MVEENKKDYFYFASESVGEGHPDKLCDQISDGILDACLTVDSNARVAMETATKTKLVCMLGEVTYNGAKVDYDQIARNVCKEVGYDNDDKGLDYKSMNVLLNIET